jgi:hypothetical protein
VNKNVKTALIITFTVLICFFLYKLIFIRTVSYEIGGIKIPSKYNILTGNVKPIKDYKGKELKRVVEDNKKTQPKQIGLSSDEVMSAQVRWAVFEQWVKDRPQYKGWDSDKEIFAKAQDDFLKEMESSGRKVTIIR